MYLKIVNMREEEEWNKCFSLVKYNKHENGRIMLFCNNSVSKKEFLKSIVQFEEIPEELVIILKYIVELSSIYYYEDNHEMCLCIKDSFGKYFKVSFELENYAIFKFLEELC